MRIVKQSTRQNPKVSLILLDWGVRESLHLLHYLKNQTASRDSFEVIVVEYYDHVSPAVRKFESEIDTWVLLQMPEDCYYHKHLMYNAGIVFSRGDILMFGDSDAMVRPTFVERIISSFEHNPLLVYHMDEFRSVRRDFYPFNYPTFEEVLGDGCINNVNGKTKGVLDTVDPIHSRNYGACMCGRWEDLVAVGGADEDLTYLGHICGPYDMTFRLMNFGRCLQWETDEYLYHTWHPGSDGLDNYLGPHDGMNMSTTAFQALCSGRIYPLVENRAIRAIRTNGRRQMDWTREMLDLLIDPDYRQAFSRARLGRTAKARVVTAPPEKSVFATYKGFAVYKLNGLYYGVPQSLDIIDPESNEWRQDDRVITGETFEKIRNELDCSEARLVETVPNVNICAVGERYALVPHTLGPVDFRIRKQREKPQIVWADSLVEARNLAVMLGNTQSEPQLAPVQPRHQAVAPDVAKNGAGEATAALLSRMDELNARVFQVETDVANIYHSRIWQTLVRIGGMVNYVFGGGRTSR